MERFAVSIVLYVMATLFFLLVAFGVTPYDATELHLLAFGLASFALAHIVP